MTIQNRNIGRLLIICLAVGLFISFLISLIIFTVHVLIRGVVIGLIIWLPLLIRHYLFPKSNDFSSKGRIIDQKDK